MRTKYVLVGVVVGVLFSVTAIVLAGNLDPAYPPASTSSYTLEDIYNRLNAGTAGSESTFTEPSSGPGTGTMHTLNDIMGTAPDVHDADGAAPGEVLAGKTYWGLRSGAWGPQVGTAAAAPVPKTGQTTPYAIGDDGDLEKGVAWPNPRFTDNDNGTVTDHLTGLIWLQDADCFESKTWATVFLAVYTLNNGECGLSDGSAEGHWRLPNVRELHSLIDYGHSYPALPSGHPFSGVQSDGYWSSTTPAGDTSNGWYVYLGDGSVYNFDKTDTHYVWPVRGGQ